MTTTIRLRTDDDLPACAAVLAAVHTGDGYPVDWPADPGRWLSPGSLLGAWVAVDGAGRAGSGVVAHIALCAPGDGDLAPGLWSRHSGTPSSGTAVVSRLFVAPGARGRNLGERLLAGAAEHAARLGLHPVLDVVESDRAAAALYERLGWRRLAATGQRWASGRTVTLLSYAA
ncbi:GNAT family N-acetyltransferase [Streptomyces sp. NPDC006798]|uniref:GNAT family N-acetyltransferase n=1 Tax=Streptomyces sp. NPDC006798 TaxID=3155462 RepID=UPI0033F90B32